MQGSLYANPAFASGVSKMLGSIFPSASETAAIELNAARAGLANDERRYRDAIGTAGQEQDLAGMLTAALQAGEGASAPGIASSLASLPQYGFDPQTQANIQVGTGTQSAQNTFPGLGQVLGNKVQMQGNQFAHEDRQAAAANEAFQSALGSLLIDSESGGDFGARNNEAGSGGTGHFGRAQFSIGRLNDAKRAGIIPASVSPDVFLANPDMQVRVEQWHRGDILAQAQANGTYSLIGSSIMGIPITEEGLVNVAHLGGVDGARRFFQSGGKYNPADANGTKLSDYLAKGAQQGGGGAAPAANGIDPRIIAMLMQAGNPNMSAPQGRILMDLADMLQPDPSDAPAGFTLSPGQTRYDGTGQPLAVAPGRPSGPDDARNLTASGRTALLRALGEDVDPMTALQIVAQAEALLEDPAMTENDALAYALGNLERGPDETEESWLPFGIGDETRPGPVVGIKPRNILEGIGQPGAAPAMPSPKSAAEMQALPSGTKFLAPDGTIRIKL